MPFISPAGNRRAAGGLFSDSILPSVVSKSKSRKPPRRRGLLRDLLFQNIFAVGLTASLLLFLFIVLRYGIPNPLSSSSSRAHKLRRTAANRKPSLPDRTTAAPGEALVDITTKDLYDKIEFLDIDGGPWKQGWIVSYKGNEWDSEKLKVFVVPHSHNDPGWKMTVEEYYNFQSKHILDTIVESLSEDTRRKFIWEEMSYLERWWRDASESKRENFIKLVKNGQLEIVGGGWVMNDEANSHYFAIIEQMMEGNMWLNNTIGVVPKNAWAIDPFGYSPTMAYLLRRMGFRNMLIQRTHYEVKKELALHKNLEYVWRQSWDTDETTDIFVHMMPFYSYDVPHTCGPDPAICCQFDFARTPGFRYEACPWHEYPVETNQENVKERALLLLDQYRKKSTLYRTNTLLVPLGDDFRYISTAEAEAQFRNYQTLFDYINSNPSLNAEASFGTLEDYFQTLRDEAERINFSRSGEVGSSEIGGFSSLSGDFFTYADRQQDYWSGYYVSRPFFKAVDRVLEQTLRATEIMMAFMLGYCQRSHCSKFPLSFSHKLTAARRNLALFQHHDGVTGTAKNHVVEDYGTRMHTSLHDLSIFMAKSVEVLLTVHHEKSDPVPTAPSMFEPEQVRSRYDVQPVHRVIDVPEGNIQSLVFFNPTEQMREEVVMVIVENPDVTVLRSNWSCVKSQLLPELQHDKDKIFTGRHRLYWQVTVAPFGLETYYVANGFIGCEKAIPAKLRLSTNLRGPAPYSSLKLSGHKAEIRNAYLTLSFDLKHGLLQKVTSKGGSQTLVREEIGIYSSKGSGAYLFKPIGDAEPVVQGSGQVVISEGPLVQEVYSNPKTTWEKTPVSHSTRIFNGENSIQGLLVEKEYHVELLGHDFNDKELIVRFKTDIDNKRVFYSDLNGFQMSRRETYDKIPLQGNYYPMPSLAFLQESVGRRFSVHSRQALGAASLRNGWLEIMLDRRLVNDDGRGLGQGVMDNRPMNVIFHLLTEVNISSSNSTSPHLPLDPSLLSYRVGAHLNYPMHAFIAKKPVEISLQSQAKEFFPLLAPLPCDLHIVSFKVPQTQKYSHLPGEPRFVIILQRRKWDPSYCRRGGFGCTTLGDEPINMFSIFKDLEVLNAKTTSLNLLHDDMEMLGYMEQIGEIEQEGHYLISPMELQAYKLEIRPQEQM
ncbi:alpha-mannosidase 2 [Aristolochia californica]|uniref:alpha-mannosidase 2 n=1 Tax=Aristolochia californica TaxID=171875 RepID=UPI0035E27681